MIQMNLAAMPIEALRGQNEAQALKRWSGAESSGQGSNAQDSARLREVAGQFDAIFIRQILREMRKSVGKSTLFGNSTAAQLYNEMFDDCMAEALGKAGGLGLGKAIEQDLSRTAEGYDARETAQFYKDQNIRAHLPDLEPPVQAFDLNGQLGTEGKAFQADSSEEFMPLPREGRK